MRLYNLQLASYQCIYGVVHKLMENEMETQVEHGTTTDSIWLQKLLQ